MYKLATSVHLVYESYTYKYDVGILPGLCRKQWILQGQNLLLWHHKCTSYMVYTSIYHPEKVHVQAHYALPNSPNGKFQFSMDQISLSQLYWAISSPSWTRPTKLWQKILLVLEKKKQTKNSYNYRMACHRFWLQVCNNFQYRHSWIIAVDMGNKALNEQ